MNHLPPRFLGAMTRTGYVRPAVQPFFGRHIGIGAASGQVFVGPIDTGGGIDPTYSAAAQTLLTELQTSGCQQSADSNVSAYQTAWNNAGGNPTLTVDGLYGANTAGALGTFNASAPTGCVAAASSTPASTTPASTPSTPANVNVDASSNTDVVPLAIAGVAAAGLVGLAIYAKKKRGYIIRRPKHHHR
jgi:hypothetical protein